MSHRNILALVIRSAGKGDSDWAGGELPMEDDHHDLVRGRAGLLQGLIRLIDQALQFLD